MTDRVVPTIESVVSDGVAEIILDRAAERNRMNVDMLRELRDAVERNVRQPEAAVLLLRGRGADFSAGLDLASLTQAPTGFDVGTVRLDLHAILLDSPKPVVTVLHGTAYAAGAALVFCSDFLIAERGARLHVPEVTFESMSLMPWLNVALLRLRHSEAAASLVALAGRPLDGARLGELGIATMVCPDGSGVEVGRRFAQDLAVNNPRLAGATKLMIRRAGGVTSGRDYLMSQLALRNELLGQAMSEERG